MRSTEQASIPGRTAKGMKVNGRTTKCMVRGISIGLKTKNISDNFLKIKGMVRASLDGQTGENTTVAGRMASSMELGSIRMQLASCKKVNGMKEKDSNGLNELICGYDLVRWKYLVLMTNEIVNVYVNLVVTLLL